MGGLVQPGTPARSPRLRSTRRVRGRPHRHLTHCESANPGPRNRLGTKPGVLQPAAGANVLAVQKLLGHETAAMTLGLYSHLFDDDLTNVAKALDKAANAALRKRKK